jgi:hypothetical protein
MPANGFDSTSRGADAESLPTRMPLKATGRSSDFRGTSIYRYTLPDFSGVFDVVDARN